MEQVKGIESITFLQQFALPCNSVQLRTSADFGQIAPTRS